MCSPTRRSAAPTTASASTGSTAADSTAFSGFEGFGGFGDIFDAFFNGTASRRPGPQRGADRRATLHISLEEAVFGGEQEIEFDRVARCEECRGSGGAPGTKPITCPECNGQGEVRRVQESLFGRFVNAALCPRCAGDGEVVSEPCAECRGRGLHREHVSRVVNVPAGVDEEHQIRLSGEGDAGQRRGPAGNVYLEIEVEPHKQFTRQRSHLVYELPLNPAQAALGADVEVPTIDGERVPLEVPPGTQPGHVFTVRGYGVPHLRGSSRGDLLVHTHVVTPTKLTDEQRELLEQLAQSLGTPAVPDSERSFMDRLREAFT